MRVQTRVTGGCPNQRRPGPSRPTELRCWGGKPRAPSRPPPATPPPRRPPCPAPLAAWWGHDVQEKSLVPSSWDLTQHGEALA